MDALTYHEATKHSPESVRRSQPLDWRSKPTPFKRYVDLPSRPADTEDSPLGRVLQLSAGITKVLKLPGGAHHFRAAACTGALYHVEVYAVGAEGIDQFAVEGPSYVRLRDGDFRAALAAATGDHRRVAEAPVSLVFTTTFWRNAWKYRARMWRHAFWDLGTMLAHTLAVADDENLQPQVVLGFADDDVNRLLALDSSREVAVAVVPLGGGAAPLPASPVVTEVDLPTEPQSPWEQTYPEIGAAHKGSSLADTTAVAAWWEAASRLDRPATQGQFSVPGDLATVIRRRGSARRFAPDPITADQLAEALLRGVAPVPSDFAPGGRRLTDVYVMAHAVDGIEAGAYRYDPPADLHLLRAGNLRPDAGVLALGQQLAADAAANVYTVADLHAVIGALGDRGYRAAQLEGGITGGRLYLSAHAQGFSATGLTFFDDLVAGFFGLDPQRYGVMFLTALGHRLRPLSLG